MKQTIITTLLAISLSSFSLFAEVTPNSPFIHVQGDASKGIKPSLCIFSFGLEQKGDTYAQSTDSVNATFEKLVHFLDQNGIPKTDLVSYELNVSERSKGGYGDKKTIYYTAARTVKLNLNKLELFPDILNFIHSLASTERISISFTANEDTLKEVKSDLLDAAISQAKQKAEHIATKLDMALAGVHAVSDENFENIKSRYIPESSSMSLFGSSSSGTKYYIPETIEVKSSIYVIYNLKEK